MAYYLLHVFVKEEYNDLKKKKNLSFAFPSFIYSPPFTTIMHAELQLLRGNLQSLFNYVLTRSVLRKENGNDS